MLSNSFGTLRWRTPRPTPVLLRRGIVTEGDLLSTLLQQHARSRHVLVTDNQVYMLYGAQLADRLRVSGLLVTDYVVEPGEWSKCTSTYLALATRMLEEGVDRGSHVIALGGGVVCNLAGFIASTIYRGLPLIHIPTSLMAQLDAAIDDKQAVNHRAGKNVLGSHYPPEFILIDPAVLKSLPLRQLRSGMAESIKHALAQSPSLFAYLCTRGSQICEIDFLESVVKETCRLKIGLLNGDYAGGGHEGGGGQQGVEHALQYGHCFGHALESATDYDISHGEAIAIGMCVTAEIACNIGICTESVVKQHYRIVESFGLPTKIPEAVRIESIMKYISIDKYRAPGEVRIPVVEDIGKIHKTRQGSFISLEPARVALMLARLKAQVTARDFGCPLLP